MTAKNFLLFLAIFRGCLAPPPPPDESGHPCDPECHLIQDTLADIDRHLDPHACHAFDHVNCNDYTVTNDGPVCGTDGQTYSSHCEYVKARCHHPLDPHDPNSLHVYQHDTCPSNMVVTSAPAGPHHPPDPHCGPDCDLINQALHNIATHFDDHICRPFDHVNCAEHVLTNDEQICGTDGKTYNTHCDFVKARCKYVLDRHSHYNLDVKDHGPCITSTTPTPTVVHTQTMTKITAQSTPAPVTYQSTSSPTNIDSNTTIDPSVNVISNLFCSINAQVDCSISYELTCGSDGKLYPNMCSLLKATCLNPSLQKADLNVCH